MSEKSRVQGDGYKWLAAIISLNLACIIYILSGYANLRANSDLAITEKEAVIQELQTVVVEKDSQIKSLNDRAYQYQLEIDELKIELETANEARAILADKCFLLESENRGAYSK